MLVGAGAAVWLAAALGGFWLWERYDATPGPQGGSAAATAQAATGGWRLTLFAHPHCPCTRTSLREMTEIPRDAPALSVRVVFVRPAGAPEEWERGDSWEAAGRMPGAEVARDVDGTEAKRLGAKTSGLAVLSDPGGRIVFRGGLTSGRGRGGDSVGRRAVLSWLRTGRGDPTAPVFGCPLFTPDD